VTRLTLSAQLQAVSQNKVTDNHAIISNYNNYNTLVTQKTKQTTDLLTMSD